MPGGFGVFLAPGASGVSIGVQESGLCRSRNGTDRRKEAPFALMPNGQAGTTLGVKAYGKIFFNTTKCDEEHKIMKPNVCGATRRRQQIQCRSVT